MQEVGKFNLKKKVITNVFEKYMNFSINNKLSFIESFQFISASLDNLVLDNHKYLRQELDNNLLNLI